MLKQSDVLKVGDGKHNAGDGLYLFVRNNGTARSWVLVKTIAKKPWQKAIGPAKTLTLAMARERARQMVAEITMTGALAKPVVAQERKAHAFADVAADALANKEGTANWKGEGSRKAWERVVRIHLTQEFRAKDVADIGTDDVLAVLRPIWTTKNPTASILRGVIEYTLDYARRLGLREGENPARWKGVLDFFLPAPGDVHVGEHRYALPLKGLADLAAKCWEIRKGCPLTFLFGVYVGMRVNEFANVLWSDIDLETRTMTIPGIRMKGKKGRTKDQVVPLSRQAMAVLDAAWEEHHGEHVFLRRSETGVLDAAKRLAGNHEVTTHGLRSTFSDWAAENGKEERLAEKALAHVTGTAVQRAYQRSDLLERRRVLMQEWADALSEATDGTLP